MLRTILRNSEIITVSKAKMARIFYLRSWYLIQLMPFERLEPYAVKVASTVLRRGRSREASSLSDIPLRSMLINGRRDTIKNSQTERSETSFKNASTGTRKSTTSDFDLLVFNHLANHNWYANYATHPIAHDEMTWHAGR